MTGRVVVVGALHHNVVVEAPHQPSQGETVFGRAWYPQFGGKGGNQAMAAAKLGAEVEMVSAVGDDAFGFDLRDALAHGGVGQAHVATLGGGSGMNMVVVDDSGAQSSVVVSGANLGLSVEQVSRPTIWAGTDVAVLQNEVLPEINAAAAKAATDAGARVIWNPAPWRAEPEMVASVFGVVVEAAEAVQMTGKAVTDLDGAAAAAQEIAAPLAVVTLGGAGLAYCFDGKTTHLHRTLEEGQSVTRGTSDVLVGALGAALAAGVPEGEAVAAAATAAAHHARGQEIAAAAHWS